MNTANGALSISHSHPSNGDRVGTHKRMPRTKQSALSQPFVPKANTRNTAKVAEEGKQHKRDQVGKLMAAVGNTQPTEAVNSSKESPIVGISASDVVRGTKLTPVEQWQKRSKHVDSAGQWLDATKATLHGKSKHVTAAKDKNYRWEHVRKQSGLTTLKKHKKIQNAQAKLLGHVVGNVAGYSNLLFLSKP